MPPLLRFSGAIFAGAFLCASFTAGAAEPEKATSPSNEVLTAPSSPTAAPPPTIAPPVLRSEPNVAYPEGASGDATILLELTISSTGVVVHAKALGGSAPFAPAAEAAALSFKFRPAERNGIPFAARIRVEVHFTEPQLDAEPTEPTPPASTAHTTSKTPIEVTVVGERKPVAVSASFSRAEVRQLPGTFGDPFRAIEAMPGVTPIASGAPFFFVRGAPPGNIGYYLDGIRVPLLYHVGFGPSVVHPGLVSSVDLYPGGYPARYGRFAGAIIAAETVPPKDVFHGEANLRLFDAGVMLEAPFAGGAGSALVGGRYSYTALLLSLLAPEVTLAYWDYQARLNYRLNSKDTLTAFSFGAFDFLGEDRNGKTETVLGSEFHRLDLRYRHIYSARTQIRTALALGVDRSRGEEDEGPVVIDYMVAPRVDLEHRLSSTARLHAGVDLTLDFYSVKAAQSDGGDSSGDSNGDADTSGGSDTDTNGVSDSDSDDEVDADDILSGRTDAVIGVYGELDWTPEPGVNVLPGLRVDFYESDGATALAIEPRIIAKYAITPRLDFKHAFGLAHQPPSFVIPIPGFQPSGLKGGLQQSVQTSAGAELRLPGDFTSSLTLFHNAFFDTSDLLSVIRASETVEDIDFETRSLGHTLGLEVFIKRDLSRQLGGFLSYTLSRSVHSLKRARFVTTFDRTHVVNLALAYDLGRRWRAGTRFVFYSGIPADAADLGSGSARRTPPFYRVDVRLEKRWLLGNAGAWWSFVFEVLNTTLNKEVFLDCDGADCEEVEVGPITIPSIGLEAGF